jgi:ATP-binding cassette subfamily B protein/subfamily B ATP-binding cassette protein MsbA
LPGQIIAIVGATGAGKSSLVSLLSRFYDPCQGRVLVDGYDVRHLSLKSLRENVSLVLQEPFLFPMSIADNIGFGQPEATRAEIITAALAAQAHDFIERLPHGYDTTIGEKGASLSGGERQRIAIARAVLKDAPILILDEPTSALDAHTEAQIFAALSKLMRGRNTFIISHRLTTIRRAEQVLVLEDGRIVERGTHESLLSRGNVYARLYKNQHLAAL